MHEEDDFLGGLGVARVEAAVHGRTSVALPHATPVRVPLLHRPGQAPCLLTDFSVEFLIYLLFEKINLSVPFLWI